MKKLKTLLNYLSWLPALVSPILLLSFSESSEFATTKQTIVQIEGNTPFQHSEDILQSIEMLKDSTSLINIRLLEESLLELNGVEKAEVFSDLGDRLFVQIEQAEPLLRLFDTDSSYYLSKSARLMALSPYQSEKVPLVSGMALSKYTSELHLLFQYIEKEDILKESIDAAWISEMGELTLYSAKGGDHKVLFGTFDDWQNKLDRLSVFYEEVVETAKRKNFDQLDLRFDGQVVLNK